MESSIINVLHIWKTLIPCLRMLGVVHVEYLQYHLIDDLCLDIIWGWKAIDLVRMVSNNVQRIEQNVLRNLIS